jgi:hypothetical protein
VFEATNHKTNAAKNAAYAGQLNGGQATNMSATESHAVTFLANRIRRLFKKGETTIAIGSRTLPR